MPNYYDLEAKMGTVSRPEYPKGVSDYRLKIKVYLAKKEDFDRYEIQSLNDENELVIAITTKRNAKPENDRWVKVDALIKNEKLLKPGAPSVKHVFDNDQHLKSSSTEFRIDQNLPF